MKRLLVLMATLVILTGCALGPSRTPNPAGEVNRDRQRYIASVAPMAQSAQRKYGVPASVSIGQSILESDWGRSGLSVWGRAYFGIKCSGQPSKLQSGCVSLSSLEYDSGAATSQVSQFRTYATTSDSFTDHGAFLRANARYKHAFMTNDPKEFIRRVGAAGYATDPTYAQTVISLIERYDLVAYDSGTAQPVADGELKGQIGDKWRDMGGAGSALGQVVGTPVDGPQEMSMAIFDKGVILWSRQHGACSLTGPAWHLYRGDSQLRDRLGVLTGEPVVNGRETVQTFANGRIHTSGGRAEARFG